MSSTGASKQAKQASADDRNKSVIRREWRALLSSGKISSARSARKTRTETSASIAFVSARQALPLIVRADFPLRRCNSADSKRRKGSRLPRASLAAHVRPLKFARKVLWFCAPLPVPAAEPTPFRLERAGIQAAPVQQPAWQPVAALCLWIVRVSRSVERQFSSLALLTFLSLDGYRLWPKLAQAAQLLARTLPNLREAVSVEWPRRM